MSKRIFVLGSANMDLVYALPRLPKPGETLTGGDVAFFPGGKGANQACAAAKLGGRTAMSARVGDDPFGPKLIASLEAAGVDVQRVRVSPRPTGCAVIYVLPSGENSIVISPGANATLDPESAVSDLEEIGQGDLLLCQLEVPLDTVEAAFAFARRRGAMTMLDPAPARSLPASLLRHTTIVTPNQTEAAILLGDSALDVADFASAEDAARRIASLGPEITVMKLGALGALALHSGERTIAEGFRVRAVDTTAAGDVFNGALAVALAEGVDMAGALRFANAAAAVSVTRPGAQPSIPARAEATALMNT